MTVVVISERRGVDMWPNSEKKRKRTKTSEKKTREDQALGSQPLSHGEDPGNEVAPYLETSENGREKNEGGLRTPFFPRLTSPSFFLSLSLFFVPNYREPGTG